MRLALFQPDIPQNAGTIIRLCACFDIPLDIIEPCGFNLNDPRFKRVVMDYMKFTKIYKYEDYSSFLKKNKNSRIVLMTTKAKKLYHHFKFKKNDMLLFGRESAGVPDAFHKSIKDKVKIPMNKKTRSLNVAMSVAIISCEALRQNNLLR